MYDLSSNLHKINIPTVLTRGKTYLHLAAQTGQIELFEAMLSEEKDKNPKTNSGQTPFHTACEFGQTQIAAMLIRNSVLWQIDLNSKVEYTQLRNSLIPFLGAQAKGVPLIL